MKKAALALTLAICTVMCLIVPAPCTAQDKSDQVRKVPVKVFQNIDESDPLGARFAYLIKEEIRRSAGMYVELDNKHTGLAISITTTKSPFPSELCYYSAVYTLDVSGDEKYLPNISLYLFCLTGYFRKEEIGSKAQLLVARADEQPVWFKLLDYKFIVTPK